MEKLIDEILDFVAECKHQEELGFELDLEELKKLDNYLGKYPDRFDNEVIRIYGNCNIYVDDSDTEGFKMLKIIRIRGVIYDRK